MPPKGHKPAPQPSRTSSPQPADCRDALQWFVDSVGLYQTSARGLIATDFSEECEPLLEAAIINLKSRGINPVVIAGDALYRQGEFLWEQAVQHTRFGRPLASQFELDMTGADVLILRNVEAPETAHHLWYLYHHVFYPRALAGKPLLMTSPLTLDELHKYGAACDDFEFAGRKVTWQKLAWLMEATSLDLAHYRTLKDEALPPMLKAEHVLLNALKERGLAVQPQHVLGDYMLDMAMIDRDRKLDIECDVLTSLDSTGANAWQAKKNLLLLSDGWKVLKFTTAEIISNTPACVDVVEEVWTQGRKRSSIGRLLSGQAAASVPELPVDDDVQRLVITHGAGPCAVEGGAGTGKSSCIIHRVAYLLAQGINPDRILVISHSQDTVKSLKSAVEAISDRQAVQRVSFHSWHDLGLKILKENLSAVKRKPPLKVESNPQKVIQRLLTKHKKDLDPVTLELSEELDEFTIASLISLYKANLITPKHLKERSKSDVDELVSKVFQGYEDQLQKINRIDKDDMVSLAAHALVDQVDLRAKYQNQYDYVLVDEYQDATAAGDLMARILAAPQDNLYLTGDEDEAIYESKGGLPRLMADVSLRMPNARCYILEKNWRCHPAIVDHTRQLIANLTRRRIQKDMTSGWGAAPTTAIIGPQFSESEEAEAEWVADEISILIDSGRNPQEIAVLYRYHRYGIIIEEALSRRNIRCVTSHPEAGLVPDEVGDVMAFLKLVMDPDGPKARESFERVCQLRVKEVDPKLSSTIASFAEANNLSYLKAVEIYSEAVAEQSCLDLSQLVRIIRTMHQENCAPAETISLLKRTQRLSDYYRAVKVPPGVNYEPLRKLTALEEEARNYKTVAEFVKAQTAIPARGSSSAGFDSDHVVHILTLHEAKGREFAVSFLVGLAEGLFPADSAMDLEEERRLCYVGMTRAKELLYLSFPSIFNNVGLQPSSFLVEARLMAQQPMHIPAPTLPPAAPQAVTQAPPAPAKTAPSQPVAKPQTPAQPVQPPKQPVQPQAQPVQPPPQPVQPQQQPVQPQPQPVQPQPQPVQPQPQPVQPQPQPVQPQPQPVQPQPQPVQPQPQPVQPQPQPVQPQPQPVQRQPQPVQPQPQPVQPPPQPVRPQPQPVQPQSQTVQPQPIQRPQPVQPPQQPVQQPPQPVQQQPVLRQDPAVLDDFSPEAPPVQTPVNPQVVTPEATSKPGHSLGNAAAGFHKAFQEQILDKHAAQQREIAASLLAAESAEKKEPPPRPGRKSKAEAAQEAAAGMGPVQAALQRRNRAKQQQAVPETASAAANLPEGVSNTVEPVVESGAVSGALPESSAQKESVALAPDVVSPPAVSSFEQAAAMQSALEARAEESDQAQAALLAAQQKMQAARNQQASHDPNTGETVIIKADLSIAHDAIAPDPVQRFTGAPPVGKRRGAQTQPAAQDVPVAQPTQPAQPALEPAAQTAPQTLQASDAQSMQQYPWSVPSPTAEPALAESFQPAPQSDESEIYSSLTSDVPPGVVIHNGPVSKGRKKDPNQVPGPVENPNLQPGIQPALSEPETVASYDYTLPPDAVGKVQQHASSAEVGGYVPPAPDEQQKMYQMFEPPLPLSTEELLAEALSSHDVPDADFAARSAQSNGIKSPFEGDQVGQYEQSFDQAYESYDQGTGGAASSNEAYDAAYQSDQFDEYDDSYSPAPVQNNQAMLQDSAVWEESESDMEHRPRCTGCGTFLEVGSQFCGECGHRLEARIPGCHLCGSPLEPSAKFCGECGSKCGSVRPAPPMPERLLDAHRIPDRQSEEYEQYRAQSTEKPTQRSWVVKLLKMLET